MIPLIGSKEMLFRGAMKRIRIGQFDPVIPDISPGIQGNRAIDLLTPKQKGLLRCALQDAAKVHKCRVQDLEWCFGKRVNGVAPLKIRKKQRIDFDAGPKNSC